MGLSIRADALARCAPRMNRLVHQRRAAAEYDRPRVRINHLKQSLLDPGHQGLEVRDLIVGCVAQWRGFRPATIRKSL
jgi:hypothetical protein